MQYEYKVVQIDAMSLSHLENELNALGAEGWQLVNKSGDYWFIFMRSLSRPLS